MNDVVLLLVLFGVFFVGFVFAFQGVVGKDLPDDRVRLMVKTEDFGRPGVQHPPESHRLRLFLIGVGLMAAAVVIALIVA